MDEGKYTIRNAASIHGQQNSGDHNINIHVDATHPVPEDASVSLPFPAIWNIPYPRNPVFTGREHLLTRLSDTLQPGEAVAVAQPQAISGLGGIGKTQLAVEYAYQHRQDYQTVLWTRADTAEALIAGYGEIAHLLDLPQKNEQEQSLVVKAVQEWLKRQIGWLLILDNADDLTLVREFLPPTFSGHLLLTTRAQTMGRLAQRIEVDTMDSDVGAVLLLRRAGLIATDASLNKTLLSDITLARAITEEMGGLPLAIDQAGAYIEETQCGLAGYQYLYQTQRAKLLALRGGLVDDHPEPVATTWSLAFQKVEQANPMAADLLRICAFLAPDAIPEKLLMEALKTPLSISEESEPEDKEGGGFASLTAGHLDEAVALLRAYSLVSRDPQAQALRVHRLVQVVLRDSMPIETQQQWMQRAISVVEAAHPGWDVAGWPAYKRLLPHALLCATWIGQAAITSPTAAHLLTQAGYYLKARGQYTEAKPLYQQALAIWEQVLGTTHSETAASLNNLAELYRAQGKYAEAEPLYQRALAIWEQELGDHPNTAIGLNNLALLYHTQGRYVEAEPVYQRALAICKHALGAMHPHTVRNLNNLAGLYDNQGKYVEAELLYRQTLAIREQVLGATHPETAASLNNLAGLYYARGRYAEAEPLLQRALAIREQILGTTHPDIAQSLNNLASLYQNQGKYAEAEPLLQRALAIREQMLGATHSGTAISLNNLAELYNAQGRIVEAEPLLVRALTINEQELGASHPYTASSLNNLAGLYEGQGKYAQAEPLYVQALAIFENILGQNHLSTRTVRANYAGLLEAMKQGW